MKKNLLSSEVKNKIHQHKGAGHRLVLVTGVFDLLHSEHIKFLQKAKQLGECLVVGLESDVRVKQLKGNDRPVWDQHKRKTEIEKLNLAEVVFILPDQFSSPADHEQLIREVSPHFLAVSAHTPNLDKKQRILHKFGGEVVVVLPRYPTVSTSQLLGKSVIDP